MITDTNMAQAIGLLQELADPHESAMLPCVGPKKDDVVVGCTSHGDAMRGLLPVDDRGECAHYRAHKLLVEMGIRRAGEEVKSMATCVIMLVDDRLEQYVISDEEAAAFRQAHPVSDWTALNVDSASQMLESMGRTHKSRRQLLRGDT